MARDCEGLHQDCMGLQGIAKDYIRLHIMTRDCEGLNAIASR